jgi:hypothetical protein
MILKKKDTYFGISGYSLLSRNSNQAGVDSVSNPTDFPNGELEI